MSAWKKSVAVTTYKKLAVYGAAGTGKTILGLSGPGEKLVIDTESGSMAYGDLTSFDVIHTQSFGEIKAAIDELQESPPERETTLVIDSASLIWEGLQQAMLEKKMAEKGVVALEGTERVAFSQADWGILKRWNKDIFTTLMSLKCHVVCTFREAELKDDTGFKGTGVFVPVWEKNSPYVFDFVGRLHDRKLTWTKGRSASGGKLNDMTGQTVVVPEVTSGGQLPGIWEAMFGGATVAPKEGHVAVAGADDVQALAKNPESLTLSREIRSKLLPKAGIGNEDFDLYVVNKTLKDGVSMLGKRGEDGKVHLSAMEPEHLRWLRDVLSADGSRLKLIKRIEQLKKEGSK